ncbi:hypothetical protein [Thiosulfativibrio zosterae]|nr:hypothetical protein [Thiosulfativibrio zosterae]
MANVAPEERLFKVDLTLESSQYRAAKISDSSGKLGAEHSKVSVGNFLVTASYEHYQFQNDEIQSSDLHYPIHQLHEVKLETKLPYPLKKDWLLVGGLQLINAYEKQFSKDFTVQGFGLVSHQVKPLLSWQLGGYVSYHPVETQILPIMVLTYNYQSPEHRGFYGHLGFPKTQIGYHFTPKLRSDIGAIYQEVTGQLAENNLVAAKGYFQLTSWRAEWATYYDWSKKLAIKLALKMTFDNEIDVFSNQYQKQKNLTLGNESGFGAGLIYHF